MELKRLEWDPKKGEVVREWEPDGTGRHVVARMAVFGRPVRL